MSCCGPESEWALGRLTGEKILKPEYWLLTDYRQAPPGGWSVNKFVASNPVDLVDKVMSESEYSQDYIRDWINKELASRPGVSMIPRPVKEVPPQKPIDMSVVGPALWAMMSVSVWDHEAFVDAVTSSIGVLKSEVGCEECLQSIENSSLIARLDEEYLIEKSRGENGNSWTFIRARRLWEFHNSVNKKLGKRELSWEAARELWGWPVE